MKKIAVMMVVVLSVVAGSYADLVARDWNSLFTVVPGPVTGTTPSGDGVEGFGQGYSVMNLTTSLDAVTDTPSEGVMLGWYDSFSGYLANGYFFNATEGDEVAMKVVSGQYLIVSATIQLPDLVDPIATGATELTFDFSGSSWQAIPEPATIGLMGIAGLGMFLARKKARR